MQNDKEMSNTYTPKTLFAFRKEDESTIRKNIDIASTYESNGVVYATLLSPKDKADLSSVAHLLIGDVTGC